MKSAHTEIKYPVGIQSFAKIREGGFLYVDKTAFIHSLKEQGGYYFLSRPRRFGKSLLLSTIEAYFQGRRDLFHGLAIERLTQEWEVCPVLHLDLNNGIYDTPEDLKQLLLHHLHEWEREYSVPQPDTDAGLPVGLRFGRLIKAIFETTGKKVVILVDEYDKPLLGTVGHVEKEKVYRSLLKSFYANLKTMDAYIRLAMLTGVARFSKVSIFSDLNNLRDISFTEEYASICGVTDAELDAYFSESISVMAAREGVTMEEARQTLRLNYDGYHFAATSQDIYNPFSLLYSFANGDIGSYWFESGTPTYLVHLLQREQWRIADIAPVEIEKQRLESAGILSDNPIPILYQAGYLTIKGYDRQFQTYTLDYPNNEVKQGFLSFLVPYYISGDARPSAFAIRHFVQDVSEGKAEAFMQRLSVLIAGVPYSEKGSAEAHFQNVMYILFQLIGFYTRMEERTSDGRIDLTVETQRYIYLFEFKVDSSSEAAMRQIEAKHYWQPYSMSGKEIILIGCNFDTKTRRLEEPMIARITPGACNE